LYFNNLKTKPNLCNVTVAYCYVIVSPGSAVLLRCDGSSFLATIVVPTSCQLVRLAGCGLYCCDVATVFYCVPTIGDSCFPFDVT